MVTVRNDIEMLATAPDGTKVKDVNLKQEAKPVRRRRSYRCVTIVGVVAVVLLSLAVGGVLLYEYVLNGTPTVNSGDESPSSTIGPAETTVHQQLVPEFINPFGGMPSDPDDDDEIDIDGTPSTTSTPTTTAATTTVATTTEQESIDEGSGVGHAAVDNEDEYQHSSGSGSGDDDMW